MTQHPQLDPSAFFLPGGPTAALLIHGFTGSPPEMRPVGDYLNARGYTVSAPLLPGHGTSVDDLNTCKWTDWTAHVERALVELKERYETVFVAGLSMGALLTLYLAERHPELPAVAVYSPAVFVSDWRIYLAPIVKYFMPTQPKGSDRDLTDPRADLRLWSYDENPVAASSELLKLAIRVRRLLPQVVSPLLVMYSTGDDTIRRDAGPYTYEHAGSIDKELVVLNNSGHCITVDSEWETVARRTLEFFEKAGLQTQASRSDDLAARSSR